MALSKMFKRST